MVRTDYRSVAVFISVALVAGVAHVDGARARRLPDGACPRSAGAARRSGFTARARSASRRRSDARKRDRDLDSEVAEGDEHGCSAGSRTAGLSRLKPVAHLLRLRSGRSRRRLCRAFFGPMGVAGCIFGCRWPRSSATSPRVFVDRRIKKRQKQIQKRPARRARPADRLPGGGSGARPGDPQVRRRAGDCVSALSPRSCS